MAKLDERTRHVIVRGLALLRDGEFFDAHEWFEAAWRNAIGDERTLFRALAQLAAAYHQLALGRARAAVRTWQKACNKLAEIDSLSTDYQRRIEAFWALLAITPDAPRTVDPAALPPREEWPLPEYLLPFVSG